MATPRLILCAAGAAKTLLIPPVESANAEAAAADSRNVLRETVI